MRRLTKMAGMVLRGVVEFVVEAAVELITGL